MNGIRGTLSWMVFWMAFLGGRIFCASPQISVDSPSGAPGCTVLVAVSFTTGSNVSSVTFDLLFSTNYLTSAPPILGGALSDHIVVSSEPSPGVRRVQIFSFSDAPLSNGVLVYLPVTIATNAPDHDEPLSLENVTDPVVASSLGGVLAISPRPHFDSIDRMADGAVHLQMTGSGNRSYLIEAATNLDSPHWTAIGTNSPVNGTLTIDDPMAAVFPIRFYRATMVR